MKFTRIIGKFFHYDNGRVEKTISVFDGTKLIGAVGSIKTKKITADTVTVPVPADIGDKIPDSYLEPLIKIGCVKTH